MLARVTGWLSGGGGDGSCGPVPRLHSLTQSLDRLEEAITGFGRSHKRRSIDDCVAAEECEQLDRLADGISEALAQAGPLATDQAIALAARTAAIVYAANNCPRFWGWIEDVGALPIKSIFDSLAVSAAQHGIDRRLHESLMLLAGTLAKVSLENSDQWTSQITDLVERYKQPDENMNDPERMIEVYILETATRPSFGMDHKIQELPTGKRILGSESEIQRNFAIVAMRMMAEAIDEHIVIVRKSGYSGVLYERSQEKSAAIGALAARLLSRKLPLTERDLADCYTAVQSTKKMSIWQWPIAQIIGATERFVKTQPINDSPLLKSRLQEFLKKVGVQLEQLHYARIERVLATSENRLPIPHSTLGLAIVDWVNKREEPVRKAWLAMLQLGLQSANKARPSDTWVKEASEIVSRIGKDAVVKQMGAWLENPGIDLEGPEPIGDIVKGMIWAVTKIGDDKLTSMLGRLCETCYKKVPGVGPANVKLGNACIYALGEMPGERAVAELVRLRSRIKFNQGRKQLEKALAEAADRAGLTVADLEEIALPTLGLDADGSRRVALGEVTVEIRIAGSDEVSLSWTGADGKPRKSVPATVKAGHVDELKALRAEIKEIKGLLAGQRFRLESLYLAQRSWPLADWRKRYLEHPLVANLARRLIWNFGDVAAIPAEDGFVDSAGKPVEPAADAVVSLWHPIEADAIGVLAWRRRLAAMEITQPFKQAHREVYLLTDAERTTETYSNRFAAHVIRQHLLNALCQTRAWKFGQYLLYDCTGAVPTRPLPGFGLEAEFWVDPIDYDQHTEATGAYHFLATDQVRFVNDMEAVVPLAQVPPILFSEVMRDVDLFIGVASIAGNPEWQDGGPEGRHREYWWGHSFGDIGARGDVRHAVLADLLPKLKIADRCELTAKFLRVRGTKRTYKIHLGSGNILMEPNDQYLCIVQDARGLSKGGDRIRLPFEGDGVLSIILSKAFLLAEDDKVTDKTILSQIGR